MRQHKERRECGCVWTATEWKVRCAQHDTEEKERHQQALAEHRRQYEAVPVTAI